MKCKRKTNSVWNGSHADELFFIVVACLIFFYSLSSISYQRNHHFFKDPLSFFTCMVFGCQMIRRCYYFTFVLLHFIRLQLIFICFHSIVEMIQLESVTKQTSKQMNEKRQNCWKMLNLCVNNFHFEQQHTHRYQIASLCFFYWFWIITAKYQWLLKKNSEINDPNPNICVQRYLQWLVNKR